MRSTYVSQWAQSGACAAPGGTTTGSPSATLHLSAAPLALATPRSMQSQCI